MRGKVLLIAAVVSTLLGCGTITPFADDAGGSAQLDGGPGRPAAKKKGNAADLNVRLQVQVPGQGDDGDQGDKGDQANKTGSANGLGRGSS